MEIGLEQSLPVEHSEQELKDLRREISRLTDALAQAGDAADAQNSFLAHVSHELRTPMNSILGMTRLTLATELSADQREYLAVVEESAESLLTLVNDLLDQAKIDAGMLELEAIPFQLDDLIASTLRGVRIMTDHKGLELRYDRSDEVPTMVVGDPTRLRQVLLNLVTNAAKFTNAGWVQLTVEMIGPDRVTFTVADTGIGISADQLDAIFEEFAQADASTTRHYGGSGLGLSISSKLVEMMGGEMTVESELSVGSTFSFTIDLPTAPPALEVPPAMPKGSSILWLTDDAASRRGAVQLVAGRGLVPHMLSSVEEAAQELSVSGAPFAAIVVDLNDSALDIAWEVARDSAGSPILVVTPGGQRGDGARCRRLGIAGYLTGPVVPSDIADALDAVVAGVPELVTRHWLNERRKTLQVLVADDSETNRTLLSRMLEARGHRALLAIDGRAVMDVLATEEVDLVLLDLHMPRLDGYDTARQIRDLPTSTAGVPIIAVSGSVSDAGKRKCWELGINDFVAKPFRPEHILELVEVTAGG